MRSIHDNHLVRYTVDRHARSIVLETEELARVEFHGVSAYHFENDALELGTILFSIDEMTPDDFIEGSAALLLAGRPYGWPGDWNKSDAAVKLHLESSGLRAFEISSSLGLTGWVLAKSFSISPMDGS
jgi:hypothetical protein